MMLVVTLGFHTYLAYLMDKAKNEQNADHNVTKVEPIDNEYKTENQLSSQQTIKHVIWMNKLGKIIFIIFLILFNILFWTVALIQHFKSSEEILAHHQ